MTRGATHERITPMTRLDTDAVRLADDEKSDKKAARGMQEKLLGARTIVIADEVDDAMYRHVATTVTLLEKEDPKAPIYVFVNSPGGSADAGFAIYDQFRFTSCPVHTIANGIVASAAVLIYLGGTPGKRFALPNARFLLHQPSTSTRGQASDIEITAKEIVKIKRRYNEIVSELTGKPVDKVEADADRDFWLSAQESAAYKLVDKVITKRTEIA